MNYNNDHHGKITQNVPCWQSFLGDIQQLFNWIWQEENPVWYLKLRQLSGAFKVMNNKRELTATSELN